MCACMICPPCSEVDHVITTKDLAAMCKEKGIDFASLPGERELLRWRHANEQALGGLEVWGVQEATETPAHPHPL